MHTVRICKIPILVAVMPGIAWMCLATCACNPDNRGCVLGEQPLDSTQGHQLHPEQKFASTSCTWSLLQVSTFSSSNAGHLPPTGHLKGHLKKTFHHNDPKDDAKKLVPLIELPFHWHDWWNSDSSLALMASQTGSFTLALGVGGFVFAVFGIVMYILFKSTKSFEKAVANEIKNWAHLDVDIADIKFYPFGGYLEVIGFLIQNPKPFKNDDDHFFLKAGLLRLDIGMWKLITSMAKDIHIDEIKAKNLEVIIEYTGYFGGSSNVQAIMEKLEGKDADKKDSKAKEDAKENKVEQTGSVDPKNEPQTSRNVTLHKVTFEDIGMKLETKLAGAHVSAGDVKYEDFSKEVGDTVVDDILAILLKSIVKTILEHMAGQNFANRFL